MFDYRYPTPLPSTKGWGPGYPDCQRDKMVPHPVFAPSLHRDIVPLVDLLVGEMRRRGFGFMSPGCWGFACKTGGGTTPSFHSWGLALDINAPRNVWGADQSTSEIATKEPWVVGFLRDYGFFWLGPAIKDWMHFHFCGSPADARDMTEKARRELGGDEMTDEERKLLNEAVNRARRSEAYIKGIHARFANEPIPTDEGLERRGWRHADAFLAGAPAGVPPHVHTVEGLAR